MSGKRLRIRARLKKLSEHNFDWLAGQEVGRKEGFHEGTAHSDNRNAIEKASMLQEIVKLESKLANLKIKLQNQSYLVLDAKRASAIQHNKVVSLELQLAAEQQRPSTSQWLHLPPFVLQKDEPWDPSAIDKDKLYGHLYGRTVTGRTPSRFPSAPPMANGGVIPPAFSNEFIERIMNGAPMEILQMAQMVRMQSPTRLSDDPTFNWNVDFAREEPSAEVNIEEDLHQINTEAVRDAFRMPLLVGSEMRSPEAEEGIRQASAEGVTDRAGGHSHTIGLDIHVDDTELQNVILRMDELVEAAGNATVSAGDFNNLIQRIAHLERMAGVEVPEESPSEANVNITGRSGSSGGE